MKLYEIPRKTYVICNGERIFFDHIDGMYSSCFVKEGPCHLAAWEEVEIDTNQEPTVSNMSQ